MKSFNCMQKKWAEALLKMLSTKCVLKSYLIYMYKKYLVYRCGTKEIFRPRCDPDERKKPVKLHEGLFTSR